MLLNDCIEELTGLKGLIVKEVKNISGELHIYGRMVQRIHSCPRCGTETSKVHDYREQVIRDISCFGNVSYIHLKKRRHVCPLCGKRFFEQVGFLPKYHRMTNRLYAFILSEFGKLQPIKAVAGRCNVSATSAARIFDKVKFKPPSKLPEVISIDEFRGNAGGEKFQCILADPKHHKVLDILPTRKSDDLYAYFSGFENRKAVKYVVMDMSLLFKEVVKHSFPNARIIADKYHVVRQVCWAMENVRKTEQKKFSDSRRKYFKRSRKLLLTHFYSLDDEDLSRLEVMLQTSERLRRAYYALQEFYLLMDESVSRDDARKRLGKWLMQVESYSLPEFKACVTAIRNWSEEILNSFDLPFTNGYTEGMNNKIKVLKRCAFGVRNFERFRNRILMVAAS